MQMNFIDAKNSSQDAYLESHPSVYGWKKKIMWLTMFFYAKKQDSKNLLQKPLWFINAI